MKNTVLKQVNDIGRRLGYPFYVYPDGTCGKSIVSGKMNAVGIVKKRFPVKELKSDFLSCSTENDEDVLKHLSQIGENIGFPLYVYADGTCGSTPVSVTNKFPFTMVIKQKFAVEQLVLDEELFQKFQEQKKEKMNQSSLKIPSYSKISSVSASSLPIRKLSPSDLISQIETWSEDDIKAYIEKYRLCDEAEQWIMETENVDILKVYIEKYCFYHVEQRLMIEKCNDDIIKMYVEKYKFSDFVEQVMIEKCSDDVIKAYVEKHELCDEAQCLMVEKRCDDIIKAYSKKYKFWDGALCLMIEKCRDDIIKLIIKLYHRKYGLSDPVRDLMSKRYGFFWFLSV